MAETDFIVAIELGSSKITGMAGRKNSDGSMYVLACASEESSLCVRKGMIYNLNKTAQCLTSIINKLEGELDAEIAQVYVGIGGQSLRTVKNTVVRHLEDANGISEELVAEINDENTGVPIVDFEILDVAPQEYRIGNNFVTDPVGVLGNHIEGRFLNIVARNTLKKNLERCFAQANIDVADYFISPVAMADVLLSDAEKRSGCALVDLGADTTTVAVYKNNILRHLSVIPIGGTSITRDICSLQIETAEAEALKQRYGNAVLKADSEDEEPIMIELSDQRKVCDRDLNDIVEARAEEIMANVWNQIQSSGYDAQLLSGIVLTGGGANLKGMEDVMRKLSKIDKVRTVRSVLQGVKASLPGLVKNDGTHCTILGLLFAGDVNCCRPRHEEVMPLDQVFAPVTVDEKEEQSRKQRVEEQQKAKEEAEHKRKQSRGGIFGRFKKVGEELRTTGTKALGGLFDDEEDNDKRNA